MDNPKWFIHGDSEIDFGSLLRIKVIAGRYCGKISATRSFVCGAFATAHRAERSVKNGREMMNRGRYDGEEKRALFSSGAIATQKNRPALDPAELLTVHVSCACHVSNVRRFIILTPPSPLSSSYVARECHNRKMIRRGISVWLQVDRRRRNAFSIFSIISTTYFIVVVVER